MPTEYFNTIGGCSCKGDRTKFCSIHGEPMPTDPYLEKANELIEFITCNACSRRRLLKIKQGLCEECIIGRDNIALALREVVEEETNRCCKIIFGQCGSDNVAQRTVDAIRNKESR